MDVTDVLIVSFENEEHKAYVELLQSYGFDIVLSAGLNVGRRFVHPLKGHIVVLDEDVGAPLGEIYEPHLFILMRAMQKSSALPDVHPIDAYDTPMYPEHYSEAEWDWLQRDRPSDFEALVRELYIWCRVRPHSMNTTRLLDMPSV